MEDFKDYLQQNAVQVTMETNKMKKRALYLQMGAKVDWVFRISALVKKNPNVTDV